MCASLPYDSPFYQDLANSLELEELENHPVAQRFIFVSFVSGSKGRGKRRKRLTEIELLRDTKRPEIVFTSFNQFPFDTVSTEVYPECNDGLEAEARLMKEVRKYARR